VRYEEGARGRQLRRHAVGPSRQQPRQARPAHRERQVAEVFAVHRQHIEGIELRLVIVLARMQRVEIGDAVDAEDDGLAIDDEL
jgi:hypothetical protein